MSPPIVTIGVDPGGRETGIVSIIGDDVVAHAVIERIGAADFPTASDLRAVVDQVDELERQALLLGGDTRVAVEGIEAPNPHVRRRDGNSMINPTGVMGTAMVLAAVLIRWPAAIVVPPGGNGSSPIDCYPAELRPTRGNNRGHDQLRHARSAYDVARAARFLARLAQGDAP